MTNRTDRETAVWHIDMAFMDSGNGQYTFETGRHLIEEALRDPRNIDSGYLFLKPSSGYEMELDMADVNAALGR